MLSDLLLGFSLMFGPFDSNQLKCLADNIYHEARGESLQGQLAVTHVVFNRTSSNKFPSTYCDVIHQADTWQGHPIRNRCQFSWYCDGKSDLPRDLDAYKDAIETAKIAWDVYYLKEMDMSNGADHYHALSVMPYWAKEMKPTATIDNHIFYKSK
jgi:spore germination cell wall hydrolase CwlJ-like protein